MTHRDPVGDFTSSSGAVVRFRRRWRTRVLSGTIGLAIWAALVWTYSHRQPAGRSGADPEGGLIGLFGIVAFAWLLSGLWHLILKRSIVIADDDIVVSQWGKILARGRIRDLTKANWSLIKPPTGMFSFLTAAFKGGWYLTLPTDSGHRKFRMEGFDVGKILEELDNRSPAKAVSLSGTPAKRQQPRAATPGVEEAGGTGASVLSLTAADNLIRDVPPLRAKAERMLADYRSAVGANDPQAAGQISHAFYTLRADIAAVVTQSVGEAGAENILDAFGKDTYRDKLVLALLPKIGSIIGDLKLAEQPEIIQQFALNEYNALTGANKFGWRSSPLEAFPSETGGN